MARPLIAVSTGTQQLATAFGEVPCTKLTRAYTDAVYAAGGQPVILPVTVEPPTELLSRMDGLLLTGGGDIDPALYGETPVPGVYGVEGDRDVFEAALYREAMALGLPILGLCRGMQLINVLRGGNLLQNIEGHWQENPATRPSHEVSVTPGTALADVVGPAGVAPVNSYHHQALRHIGTGLQVTAVCGDVVEAVEAVDADIVCVAWHPEHLAAVDPRQRALFESFVKRASVVSGSASTRS
jgi:putative glutamine amidotransferase